VRCDAQRASTIGADDEMNRVLMARHHGAGQQQIGNPGVLLFWRSVQADDSDQVQNNHQRDAPDVVESFQARCDHEDSNWQQ